MEAADGLAAELKAAERRAQRRDGSGGTARAAICDAERATLDAELARLSHERARRDRGRRPSRPRASTSSCSNSGAASAVAPMNGEICTACHVRLRPHVAQQIRRNDGSSSATAASASCTSCRRCRMTVVPGARRATSTAARAAIPGPAGWGAVMQNAGRRRSVAELMGALPHATNNVAEYQRPAGRARLVRRARRRERAHPVGLASARAADARGVQGQERRTEAALRPGPAPRAPDRPRHVRARAAGAQQGSRPAGEPGDGRGGGRHEHEPRHWREPRVRSASAVQCLQL